MSKKEEEDARRRSSPESGVREHKVTDADIPEDMKPKGKTEEKEEQEYPDKDGFFWKERKALTYLEKIIEILKTLRREDQGLSVEVHYADIRLSAEITPSPTVQYRSTSGSAQRQTYQHPTGMAKPQLMTVESVKTYLVTATSQEFIENNLDIEAYSEQDTIVVKVKKGKFLGNDWGKINDPIRRGLSGNWDRDQKGWIIPTK